MLDAKPVRSRRSALRATQPAAPLAIDNVELIRGLDLSKTLSHRKYREELEEYEGKFVTLSHHKRFARHSLILAFEGTDAAGKGGAIRRVTGALDARQYVTVPVAAPTAEERAYPYLWRFWRNIPPLGRHHHLRPVVVWPCAGGTRRGAMYGGRLDARVPRDQSFRGTVDARRRHRRQVLAADQQGGAIASIQETRNDFIQAFQDHAGRLAQSREVGCLRTRGMRYGRSDQH